jgi:CheY-like chemotaxis protein
MSAIEFTHRAIIVEDDRVNREIIQEILEAAGFEVRATDDGFEALVILRGAPPDVLISDLEMPKMSGFELLSIVRRRFPRIGVVVVSGAFRAGGPPWVLADSFVSKPFRPQELLDAVAYVVKVSPIRSEVAKAENAPIWIPRQAPGYYVITCTDCLRSFPISPGSHSTAREGEVECLNCGVSLRYVIGPKNRSN